MVDKGETPNHTEFLRNLRQSRRFLDKPVPQEVIDDLIAVARATGSADQAATWQFIVVDDLVTKRALSEIGAFTEILAQVAVAIVMVLDGTSTPSKANVEGRVAERIMLAAGRHGLASGTGWFGGDEAQDDARAILGVKPPRYVWAAVGIGYVAADNTGESTSLERIRQSLDSLTAKRPKPTEPRS